MYVFPLSGIAYLDIEQNLEIVLWLVSSDSLRNQWKKCMFIVFLLEANDKGLKGMNPYKWKIKWTILNERGFERNARNILLSINRSCFFQLILKRGMTPWESSFKREGKPWAKCSRINGDTRGYKDGRNKEWNLSFQNMAKGFWNNKRVKARNLGFLRNDTKMVFESWYRIFELMKINLRVEEG